MKKNQQAEHKSQRGKGMDAEAIYDSLGEHLTYSLAKTKETATDRDWYQCLAMSVRDRMVERLMSTIRDQYKNDSKRVYYLSLEFLIGRSLMNSILNLDIEKPVEEALKKVGLSLDSVRDLEDEAALGNGGLGRLAACFMDSLATLNLPGYGYGIRYEYGMFNQRIHDGWQVEHPENWLRYNNPWELPRSEVLYPVHFFGRGLKFRDEFNNDRCQWVDTDTVMAMAYDMPIPGHGTDNTINLRLWSAKSTREFELGYFNEGNYIDAVGHKNESENLSKVLYPSDTTFMGRTLRLKQEYFFVSASLQDILRRYAATHEEIKNLPQKVVIHLNDTHPALAIPELLRLLMDETDRFNFRLGWDEAWAITRQVFAYTNHTLLPEALETWPIHMMEKVLPRHLAIIYEINHHFLKEVAHHFPGDLNRIKRMSLIDEDGDRRVRMAHLAIVGSQHINGVSELHSALVKSQLFADFYALYPNRFTNVTNGVTPRRWINQANPNLRNLLTDAIGNDWVHDLTQLAELEPLAEDSVFQEKFLTAKLANKERLNKRLQERPHMKELNIRLNLDSLFDVQIKRIHEYKRQWLKLLHVITLYNRYLAGELNDPIPRTVIFAGKAAPGYAVAKLIIKLINDVADVINNDPRVADMLKVLFIPNYDVTTAGDVIPAADLSEQISTAGMEASGTGNMKFALNGALTIGTLDGANIEIMEEVGEENIFIFGNTAQQVAEIRRQGYNPRDYYYRNPELKKAMDQISSGYFSADQPNRFQSLTDSLLNHDYYLVLADYSDYVLRQEAVDQLFRDPKAWSRKAILNIARMGKFSSDRSVNDYAKNIWGLL